MTLYKLNKITTYFYYTFENPTGETLQRHNFNSKNSQSNIKENNNFYPLFPPHLYF